MIKAISYTRAMRAVAESRLTGQTANQITATLGSHSFSCTNMGTDLDVSLLHSQFIEIPIFPSNLV